MSVELAKSAKEENWFVVRLQPGRDAIAAANLRNIGCEFYCPVIRTTVRHARQFREKLSPVFPGYAFVSFDARNFPWRRINGTRGVVALLTVAGEPARLPHHIVENLRSHYGCVGEPQSAPVAVGDRIRLMGGPFANLVGTLSALDARGRIEVLLDILGMRVAVKTDIARGIPLPVALQ